VTIYIADIASYQQGLTADDLLGAGFTAVNVKVSHGLTQKSVHVVAGEWLNDPRFQISTFHWLDGTASGAMQAGYAYMRMAEMMPVARMRQCAHVVDVESAVKPPTELIWRDYCVTMAQLLGRPIVTYTGDWWWAKYASGWGRAPGVTPWLWSAPNDGYMRMYPGDNSPHWRAGYGGWAQMAVMQYAVEPVAGIRVSMSAVRSMEVWDAMRGVRSVAWVNTAASDSLRDEFNEAFPNRTKASDGTIGDGEHSQSVSDHNPDETGNTGGKEDSDSINEVHARDLDKDLNRPGWTMERATQIIMGRCRSGAETRLDYWIYNRRIWRRSNGWVTENYTGANQHTEHAHGSFRYGSGSGSSNPENDTRPWGILAEIEREEGIVDQAQFNAFMDSWVNSRLDLDGDLNDSEQAKRFAYAPWQQKVGGSGSTTRTYDAVFGPGGLIEIVTEIKQLLGGPPPPPEDPPPPPA